MRMLVLVSIVILHLAGCTVICPQQKQPLFPDQVAFSRAFDHFQLTRDVSQLQQFKKNYPESVWAERAGFVLRHVEQLKHQKQRVDALSVNIKKLKGENRQLSEKLEQLKGLLIQLEAQPQ